MDADPLRSWMLCLFFVLASFAAPTAVAGTCVDACGEFAGDCFCDANCVAYGDCCPDYEEECASNSCEGRCGGAAASCHCDDLCWYYGDCCIDIGLYCYNDLCTSDGDCDDGVDCTVDTCDWEDPASDDAGCVFTPDDDACDDGNVCSIDTCDPELGCVHTVDPLEIFVQMDRLIAAGAAKFSEMEAAGLPHGASTPSCKQCAEDYLLPALQAVDAGCWECKAELRYATVYHFTWVHDGCAWYPHYHHYDHEAAVCRAGVLGVELLFDYWGDRPVGESPGNWFRPTFPTAGPMPGHEPGHACGGACQNGCDVP